MGAKDSKPSCINYEDAIKRVSDSELKRIKEAFKRSAGAGNISLSRSAFIQDVLCEGVPTVVADWLYTACGGTQKGISFKELICGLVLLTKGTFDEKIKFLWNLYCNDSGTHILRQDFTKALQVESTYQSSTATILPSSGPSGIGTPNNILILLFGQSDRVTFDQFKSWMTIHKGATVLSRWLLLEPYVNLSSELETPTFFQSLAGVTHLEEQDIRDLEKVFWRLKGSALTGQLDLESLGPLLSPPVPRTALSGVFHAFDENRDGHIDFKELCCGVSAACRGPSVERSKFCFKVFDTDRDGLLSYSEINQMINILIFVAKESSNASNFKNVTFDTVIAELYSRVRKNMNLSALSAMGKKNNDSGESSTSGSEESTPSAEITVIEPFNVTQEDFLMWSVESSLNLVQQFLDLLFEVCHIVLGLRPQCRHLEHDIVKGWMSREVKRGYKVGQFWYLISSEWWQNWLQYTQNPATAATCTHCKTTPNYVNNRTLVVGGIDEAMVCDESFTSNSTESMGDLLTAGDSSSLGSGSSGISCGRQSSSPPGQIDNRALIAPIVHKNVQTLTGEGGRLKRDLTLAQHRDFELVPDSLWKALSLWYQGPLPLPRQVIQPPNTPDVELELYPLNLRILRHQNPPPVTQTSTPWGAVSGGYGALSSAGSYTTVATVPQALQPPKKYLAYTAAFSKLASVKQVGEFLCQRLKLRLEDVRLWHVLGNTLGTSGEMSCLLEEENMTLQELLINDNDQILLEIRNKDLTWPEELGSLTLSNSGSSINQERRATIASIQSVHPPGATGLHNLGNTCFMNAALQVLFNTQPLTQYFRQNMHMYELNTTNKLGTKGQLVIRYSELLKEVWTASTRSIAPLKLRFCVTKHAPRFAGGGQHDSQELLEWLLDALHEDLNRVTEKPYSELKDSDGRADAVVAAEAWSQHSMRNQSIVIDLFYGQLKSKVSCLECGRDSVRFDPFSLLSLPLPVENFTYCEVLVILLDGSIPTKYGLRLNSDYKYYDLKKELSTICNLEPELMLCCEISDSQVKHSLLDDQKIKSSTATELYVYELPKGGCCDRPRTSSELGVNIEKGLKDIQRNPALLMSSEQHQLTTTSTISSGTDGSGQSEGDALTSVGINSIAIGNNNSCSGIILDTNCCPTNATLTTIATKPITTATANRRTSKQSEVSTSPENNFIDQNYINRKTISTTNLLSTESLSASSSLDESVNIHQHFRPLETISGDIDDHSAMGEERKKCSNHLVDHDDETIEMTTKCNCLSNGGAGKLMTLRKLNKIGDNSADCSQGVAIRRCNYKTAGYLLAVHRQLSRQDTYFLSYHKTKPNLFGVPLLIPCYEGGTNKDLYCAVWVQVARLLSPLPPTPPDQANHATDCDDSLGYEFPFTLRAVAEGGRVCALCPWSRFCRGCEIPCNDEPLLQGSLITDTSSASSTPIPSHREYGMSATPSLHRRTQSDIVTPTTLQFPRLNFGSNASMSAINIAIDWDPTALHLRYQSTREKIWTEHSSVAICRKQQTEPVDLDHCLRAFTSEEKLEQWYHCSHCKGKKPATKKLQIWKLPPILIIHLKRFNFVNNKWVKSQKVVNFPFKDFDPTPYLASVPQETILRHKELRDSNQQQLLDDAKNMCNFDCDEEIIEFDRENYLNSANNVTSNNNIMENDEISLQINPSAGTSVSAYDDDDNDEDCNDVNENDEESENDEDVIVEHDRKHNGIKENGIDCQTCKDSKISVNKENKNLKKCDTTTVTRRISTNKKGPPQVTTLERRKRLISASLTKTPVIDGEFIDFHNHKLKNGQDPFDLKYQLYAVVSHSGMLNGGHYISYAANPNGSWYCYNDSSCREIPCRPNIDPGSAYLLFYERQGLDYPPYLPKVDGRSLPNGNILDVDDNDSDLRKMCVIA